MLRPTGQVFAWKRARPAIIVNLDLGTVTRNAFIRVRIPHFCAGEKVTTLSLEGRLDAAAVTAIQGEFLQKTAALKKPALVDMSQVTFMASLCIRMLVEAAKALRASGARLALLKPNPLVERALKASGFHLVVGIYHDEETALEGLSSP